MLALNPCVWMTCPRARRWFQTEMVSTIHSLAVSSLSRLRGSTLRSPCPLMGFTLDTINAYGNTFVRNYFIL